MSDQPYTLLDGTAIPTYWWYSVGNTKNFYGGNPGLHPIWSTVSELFVCIPGTILNIFKKNIFSWNEAFEKVHFQNLFYFYWISMKNGSSKLSRFV